MNKDVLNGSICVLNMAFAETITLGSAKNAAANTPKRLHACRDSLQIRWQHLWKAFSKAKWPGSHDLPIEATHWCGHNVKTGVKSFKPFHVCKLCGIQVEGHSWYLYSCPATKSRKPLPSLKERKVIWAKCRKEAQQSVKLSKLADGTSAAKKGLRAKRLGEAKNPGPEGLTVWSQNIRSWQRTSSDCPKKCCRRAPSSGD